MVSSRDINIEFSVRQACMVSAQQLEACAQLFSQHYGVWGVGAPIARQGQNVELSARLLKQQYLFNNNCSLCLATLSDGTIVGHAFATKFAYNGGSVSWVTQLVVHKEYRNQGVASKLCHMLWDVNVKTVGYGIVTSHPHAIRALERATSSLRRCKSMMTGLLDHASSYSSLISASGIPYLQGRNVYCESTNNMCKVDTCFFVDHTDVNQLIPDQPSRLGLTPLEEGHEFVAFIALHGLKPL